MSNLVNFTCDLWIFKVGLFIIQAIIDKNKQLPKLEGGNLIPLPTWPIRGLVETPKKSLRHYSTGGPLKMDHAHFCFPRVAEFPYLGHWRS